MILRTIKQTIAITVGPTFFWGLILANGLSRAWMAPKGPSWLSISLAKRHSFSRVRSYE